MKKIKIFNGRWKDCRAHAYVGAYTQKHAIELLQQAGHTSMSQSEMSIYWSKGCWGTAMDGIKPQVGVWVREGHYGSPVKRLI
jgi:hypothetical protein